VLSAISPTQIPSQRRTWDRWSAAALLAALFVAFPVATVLFLAVTPDVSVFSHLASTVLPRYLRTTAGLMLGVGIGVAILGVATAWLVTMCRFPGVRVFQWALLLPLAIPAYVIAFIYTEILDFSGPIQTYLRALYGWKSPHDYWFPEIRSLGGAIAMMTLVLYPYVYLLARAAFLEQAAGLLEVSRTLGRGPWRSFFTVSLPLARPAIVIGISLALMETLNDFGTVDFFAVQTLTLGIYDVWRNMNSLAGAAQIASLIVVLVVALILAERAARRRQRYFNTTRRQNPPQPVALSPLAATCAFITCLIPVTLGFVLPAGRLVYDALLYSEMMKDEIFLRAASNSLMLSSLAAIFALAIAIVLAYGARLRDGAMLRTATRLAGVGYAVPGAVLAIGIIIPMAAFDNALDGFLYDRFGWGTGLLLSGTITAVTFGYVVRFLALALGAVESSLARVTPSIDGAARTLGAGPGRTLWRIHLPIMRGSMLAALILVFVDGMKELPMTIVMRPFNFETLATQVHQYSATERFAQAAPSALGIVLAGLLPVILLSRAIVRRREEAVPTQRIALVPASGQV
jgi:iron(III) transport system permease protein